MFSASFQKINQEDQRSDETELFWSLNPNHRLTEIDIDNVDIKSQLEHQIEIQEIKESGSIFDKTNSKNFFHKTGELNGSSYVKIPSRSKALLNVENNDKYCFLWSISAILHPCKIDLPNRVSIYRQNLDEVNIERFDFSNGFKRSDVHKFEKLKNL